jgi:hypothetical protein
MPFLRNELFGLAHNPKKKTETLEALQNIGSTGR